VRKTNAPAGVDEQVRQQQSIAAAAAAMAHSPAELARSTRLSDHPVDWNLSRQSTLH